MANGFLPMLCSGGFKTGQPPGLAWETNEGGGVFPFDRTYAPTLDALVHYPFSSHVVALTMELNPLSVTYHAKTINAFDPDWIAIFLYCGGPQ